jgi:hypothetical protein
VTTKLLLIGFCVVTALGRALLAEEAIPLTITEPSGAARMRWPVTCGVPFPKGLVRTLDQLRLSGPTGEPIPAQWRELGRWLEDRSPRVAACSFVADFEPNQKQLFTVTYAGGEAAPAHEQPVTVTESSDGYVIANGVVQVSVRKQPFALIDRLAFDVDGDGRFADDEVVLGAMSASVQDEGGTTFSAAASSPDIDFVERGPVRVTLRAQGKFTADEGAFYAYDMLLSVSAGSPLVHITHRLINTEGEPEKGYEFPPTPVRRVEASWPLGAPVESIFDALSQRPQPWAGRFRVAQTSETGMTVYQGRNRAEREGRFPGWLDLTLGKAGLAVGIEDFWQLYPKAMGVTAEGRLRLDLIPGLYEDFGQGMAKTHNIFLLCHSPEDGVQVAHDFGKALGQPLIWTNPDWFSRSGVFGGHFGTHGNNEYDQMVDRMLAAALQLRERQHSFGLKNFGCWVYSEQAGYGQNQYNTVLSLLLHFLRSGDYRYFQTGREHFYHLADVDTCHYATHAWDRLMLGGKRSYHWSHTTSAMSPALSEGAWDCLAYYYLTGDPYAWEVARGQADASLTFFLKPFNIGRITPSERDSGIPLFQLCELYRATGDQRYLAGAKQIVDYRLGEPVEGISEEQRAKGRQDPVHGCWHHSYGTAACTWLTASSLIPGLAKYYEITGEERAKEAAVRACYWVMRVGWDPAKGQLRRKILYEGVGGPLDKSYPLYSSYYGGIINLLSLPAFTYGYELTGDQEFLRVGRDVLRAGMRDAYPSRFKEFGQATKWTPFFLYHLDQR